MHALHREVRHAAVLTDQLVSFDREARLDARSRIDFLVPDAPGRVGIEVKVAGTPDNVRRQLTRYAPHVDALLLVTTRVRHRYLQPPTPATPGLGLGKPLAVLWIASSAW